MKSKPYDRGDPAEQFVFVETLDAHVKDLIERHQGHQTLWWPSQWGLGHANLIEQDQGQECDEQHRQQQQQKQQEQQHDQKMHELRARARTLPLALRVALELNTQTEKGLPLFTQLIALASPGAEFSRWKDIWTAEENRHGSILEQYLYTSRLFNLEQFERRQFDYISSGFRPAWMDQPYGILLYVVLQEEATRISHDGLSKLVVAYEPVLAEILHCIAEDEARHYAFYTSLFGEVVKGDAEGALMIASSLLPRINMPGMSLPGFADSAEVVARLGIYNLEKYRGIVVECIRRWKIAEITNLTPAATRAQAEILRIPKALEGFARRLEGGLAKKKTISFPVIDRILDLGEIHGSDLL